MSNYGKYRYIGDEGTNIVLGQTGFKVLSGGGDTGGGEFVAIKAAGGSAEIYWDANIGDSLAADDKITLADGDTIYGAFSQVYTGTVNGKVLVYYG